jgi:hypothetical protein
MNAEQQEKYDRLVGPVIGKEPYESVFRRIAGITLDSAATKKEKQAARREWLAFMRTHVMEYLMLWPDQRDHLVAFLEHFTASKKLRPQTLADATTILEIARYF